MANAILLGLSVAMFASFAAMRLMSRFLDSIPLTKPIDRNAPILWVILEGECSFVVFRIFTVAALEAAAAAALIAGISARIPLANPLPMLTPTV